MSEREMVAWKWGSGCMVESLAASQNGIERGRNRGLWLWGLDGGVRLAHREVMAEVELGSDMGCWRRKR